MLHAGNALLAKLRAVALTEEDDAVGTTVAGAAGAAALKDKRGRPAAAAAAAALGAAAVSAQPAWMVAAGTKAREWLALLPTVRRAPPPGDVARFGFNRPIAHPASPPEPSAARTRPRSQDLAATATSAAGTGAAADPISRCIAREVSNASALLKRVRRDLEDLVQVCEGTMKQTNHLRAVLQDVNRSQIPRHWRKYKVPSSIALPQWVADFAARVRQLEQLASPNPPATVWLGGLLAPEAYITATRQAVAQSNRWSLEELVLRLELAPDDQVRKDTFLLSGLRLEGAAWTDGRIEPSVNMATRLPTVRLCWVRRPSSGAAAAPSGADAGLVFPVYLNASRADLLFSAQIPVRDLTEQSAALRAIALVASPLK